MLPVGVPVISVEASGKYGWQQLSHVQIGLDEYGRSAPLKDVQKFFGFQPEQIAETVGKVLGKTGGSKKMPTLFVQQDAINLSE